MSIQVAPLFLVEIAAWDPALATTRTLRYANRGYVTSASATPANTFYDERLSQPSDITRTMFSGASTRGRSTIALGDVILNNGDGLLDDLNELGFDGRTITVRRSTVFNPAYPADFTTIFVGSLEQPEFSLDTIRLKLRDRMYAVASAPLQTTTYAGSNVLPAGLEGTSDDLQGKVKPRCLGVVKNIAPPCVNTSKLIYQVNNGAVNSIDAVYDRGVALTPGRKWTSAGVIDSNTFLSLAAGNNVYAAGTLTTGKIYTSPDGITWTLKQTFASTAVVALAYGGGNWIGIVESAGSTLAKVSTDNFGTVASHAIAGSPDFLSLSYNESAALFIGGTSDGKIYTSPDGTTWTLRYTTANNTTLKQSVYGNGVTVIIGFDTIASTGAIYSSADGINWGSRVGTAVDTSFGSVTFGNELFVAIGTHTSLASDDGFNWTVVQQTSSGFSNIAVTYSGLFVASGISTPLRTSADGITWADSTSTLTLHPLKLTAIGTVMVAVMTGGEIFYTSLQSFASSADLLDDTKAPMPGEYTAYLAGGYFRLGGTPDGIVTADVTQGANAAARTGAQMFSSLVTAVGETPSSADVTAMDVANSHVLGVYVDADTTYDVVIDQIAGTLGAAWYPDASGVFRLKQLVAPTGTADLVITENDILSIDKVTSNDDGNGIPIHKVVVRWGRFYTTITTDIAGAVTDASRAQFANEWRDVESSDSTVVTAHPSSQILTIESLYSVEADAQTESDRQLALRSVKRDTYEVTLELNSETAVIDINSVLEIQHPRFSLSVIDAPSGTRSGGGLFRVLDVRPNAKDKQVTFTVWGRSRYQNRATVADPVASRPLRVTRDGKYRITTRVA